MTMKNILTLLFTLVSVFAFGQFYNAKQYRVVARTDSAIISGVGQIAYDAVDGKLRFGNGTAWQSYWPTTTAFLYNGATTTLLGQTSLQTSSNSTGDYLFRVISVDSPGESGFYLTDDFGSSLPKIQYSDGTDTYTIGLGGASSFINSNISGEFCELSFLDDSGASKVIFSDGRASKRGIEYGASGYVTQAQSLADKEYVDDAVAASISTATVSVSSAEILAINTTPKVIISAPGAGKFIQVISIMGSLDFVSSAYATNFQLEFRYNATSASLAAAAWNIAQTEDKIFRFQLNSNTTGEANASIINQPVTLNESTGNPTTGDGTLKVYITYRIVDL